MQAQSRIVPYQEIQSSTTSPAQQMRTVLRNITTLHDWYMSFPAKSRTVRETLRILKNGLNSALSADGWTNVEENLFHDCDILQGDNTTQEVYQAGRDCARALRAWRSANYRNTDRASRNLRQESHRQSDFSRPLVNRRH